MPTPTIYDGFKDLPNRRGEYLINAQFADCKEVCLVTIGYDIDEEKDVEIKSAYSYIVTSENKGHLYTCCFGFSSIANTIAECEARVKTIF